MPKNTAAKSDRVIALHADPKPAAPDINDPNGFSAAELESVYALKELFDKCLARELLAERERRVVGLVVKSINEVRRDLILPRSPAMIRDEAEEKAKLGPTVAPELWKERDLNKRETIDKFIFRVYAPWLISGFERRVLSRIDPPCYKALSVFLTRNPQHALATALFAQPRTTQQLIDVLSDKYSLDELRRVGYAIDAQMRRAKK